ncbi:MAG: hypothetical protein WBW84_09165 [Acidobacteriaceae bacterium]
MPVLAMLAVLWGMAAPVHAQTAVYSGSTSTIDSTDFGGPMGITTDASGNLFVADNGTKANGCNGNSGLPTVCELKLTAPGTYSAPIPLGRPVGGFVCPKSITEPDPCLRGISVDPSGNLWIAGFGNYPTLAGQVYELPNVEGTFAAHAVAVGTGWQGPWGITHDAAGNVFVGDNAAQTILEISSTSISMGAPKVTTIVNWTGGNPVVQDPRGIAVDSSDTLYVVDSQSDHVVAIAPPYTSENILNDYSFYGPGDLALDAGGNIWVSEFSTNSVRELTAASGYDSILSWGSGLNGPVSVWPGSNGAVFVSDYFNYAVKQIATQAVNFKTVAVGSTSGKQTLTFTFKGSANTTIQAPMVVTQGATGLDFADAGTGTCTTTNGTGHPWAPKSTCTVDVKLNPKYAGMRYGAVELLNTSGTLLATAYIYGTGQGPQLMFPSNTTSTMLGGGYSGPEGMAVDASGNVYVADAGNRAVKEMPPGCTSSVCVSTLGGGFNSPYGVAVDGSGDVYVADTGNSAVKQIPLGCNSFSCVTTLGGGFLSPTSVAVDGAGNLYVADNGNSAVKEIPPGCTSSSCVTTLGGGFLDPAVAVVDGSGNVYVADTGNNAVKKIPAGCISSTCVTTLGGGFDYPFGVAVDAGGKLYVANNGSGTVIEVPPGCTLSSCVTTLRSGFSAPAGVAQDDSGNLYVVNSGNNMVEEVNLGTPPSLSFVTTKVGSQSSDSPQTVTLSNIGNASLTFPVPGTGENPSISANFNLDGSTTCPEVTTSSSAGTLAAGANCNLAMDFIPTTTGEITGSAVLTDNNLNASPAVTQSIGLSGTGGTPTPIVPYIQVIGGAWTEIATASVNLGATVNLGPQPVSGGSWSWAGPNGFSSTSRVLYGIPLTAGTNTYTATYTNTSGGQSTQAFTITVSTPVVPYIQVSGGGWTQESTVTVNLGSVVNLGPQPVSGGSWSWAGPNGFTSASRVLYGISLSPGANTYTATYTNTLGGQSTQAFTITVSTPVVPYIQVSGGGWTQEFTATVNLGSAVNLGPQPVSGGSWSWTGPNGFSSTSRVLYSIPLTTGTNTYTATYTNTSGGQSTQTFTIIVNTPVDPWIQVNGGAWQQVASIAVNPGDTVNLGPHPVSGGSWSWSGPNGFTSTARVLYAVPLTTGINTYTATYTNTAGAQSTQIITITVN